MRFKKMLTYVAGRQAEIARERQAHMVDRGPVAVGRLVIETQPCDPITGKPVGPWQTIEAGNNLVVTQAESLMAQMAIGAANSALSYIELGDPAAPAAQPLLTNTSLQQTTGQRKAVTATASNNVVTCTATWSTAEGNGFTYTESGLFTGLLGAGTMFARKVFNPIAKTNAFQLRFTWYITFLVNTSGGDCTGVSFIGPTTVASTTVFTSTAGGEVSVAATFDFTVGANHLDVFLNGVRLVPGVHYTEVGLGALTAPVGGAAGNKGINFVSITLNISDVVFLIQRVLA